MKVGDNRTQIERTRNPDSKSHTSPSGGGSPADEFELNPSKSKHPLTPLKTTLKPGSPAAELTPEQAATKMLALRRVRKQARQQGDEVRKKTVLPSEIKRFLDASLSRLDSSYCYLIDTNALSQIVAREILRLDELGSLGKHGEKIQIYKNYAFPQTLSTKKKILKKKNVKAI